VTFVSHLLGYLHPLVKKVGLRFQIMGGEELKATKE
jgi:hypothetical protein